MPVKITVNGEEKKLEREISLLKFLEENNINTGVVVVEYNYDIPDREKWKEIILSDGDRLEILQFVGGG
jgi:sulfur carrier protein